MAGLRECENRESDSSYLVARLLGMSSAVDPACLRGQSMADLRKESGPLGFLLCFLLSPARNHDD